MKYSFFTIITRLICSLLIAATVHAKKPATITLDAVSASEAKPQETASSPEECAEKKDIAQDIVFDPVKSTASARRKRQSIYKKKKVYMRDMTYEELKETKNERINEKNIEAAIKYAEKMLPLCKDMHEQKDLMLELANLLFDHGELEKAGKIYQEFVKLYPGTTEIEHASYRAILCSFYAILDCERDQTKTKETVDLTVAFLERSEIFTEKHDEVLTIQRKCYERLVESEFNVLNYYVNNERFTAAQTRIDGMRKDYAPKMADLEPRLLFTEIVLADKQGKIEIATEKRLLLTTNYPSFNAAEIIAAHTPEKSFADKF